MSFLKALFFSVIFIVILFAWHAVPIMKPLPKPTGSYRVGFVAMDFVDEQRNEQFAADQAQKRRLALNIWYPAASTRDGYTRAYLGEKMSAAQTLLAQKLNVPLWVGKLLLHNIKTDAFVQAPMASEHISYPVILFSHGLLGEPSDTYSALCENMASHGFVVVGIDHAYFNLITRFADGTVVSCAQLANKFQRMSVQEQYDFQRDAIAVYKDDMSSVLNYLEQINDDNSVKKSLLCGRMNLGCVGVMGHSAGGTAAIEFCREDARCKVAVNLDGWYDHVIGWEPLEKPLLMIFGSKSVELSEPSAEYLKRKGLTREQYFERENKIAEHRNRLAAPPHSQLVILPDVAHGDFGDSVLFKWPLRTWSEPDGYQVLGDINSHIISFLSRYLCV